MKHRSALIITTATGAIVFLACAACFFGPSDHGVEVEYVGVLADKGDVHTIRHIVSHEQWAALYRSVRRRDARCFQESLGQLAYGKLRQITGTWGPGPPDALAIYENTRDKSRCVEYALRYHKGRWTFAGSRDRDLRFET